MYRIEVGSRVSLVCLALLGGVSVVRAAEAGAKPAHLTVRLPAGAVLIIGGLKSTQEGPVREFDSPPLPLGQTFAYQITATWRVMDREVVREERVLIHAGDNVEVDLNTPAPEP